MMNRNEEPEWDREADVIIAGFGGADACAALAAYDAGARVLVIEKAPFGGGNTGCALGPMRLPSNVDQGVPARRQHFDLVGIKKQSHRSKGLLRKNKSRLKAKRDLFQLTSGFNRFF